MAEKPQVEWRGIERERKGLLKKLDVAAKADDASQRSLAAAQRFLARANGHVAEALESVASRNRERYATLKTYNAISDEITALEMQLRELEK